MYKRQPKEANQSLEKEGNNTYLSIQSDFAAGQRYPVATKSIDYAEKQILHFSGKLRLQKHASVNPMFKFVTEEDKTIMAVSYTHLDVYKRQVVRLCR